jgi:biopolymer transport protein TolR
MGASSLRKSKRRAMSDINVVPYIDVMLVLLVIFMVTAPMVNPGVVDLPTMATKGKTQPLPPIYLTIDANENITIRSDGEPVQNLKKSEIGAFARNLAEKDSEKPVVIAADKTIKYEQVVDVMAALKENGVKRAGLLVKGQ